MLLRSCGVTTSSCGTLLEVAEMLAELMDALRAKSIAHMIPSIKHATSQINIESGDRKSSDLTPGRLPEGPR